jgi:hypothetical protein
MHSPSLLAAFYLMNHGANVTQYQLPVRAIHETLGLVDIGYGPAMLYALGMGGINVNENHAAILQRLHDTLSDHFDLVAVRAYLQETGNPPLLHIPAYVPFTEGVHVLLEDFQLDVNERDQYGATALHAAVWQGQVELVIRLLSKGADRLIPDIHGRTALHYAILRGHTAIAGLLCVPPRELTGAKAAQLRNKVRVYGRVVCDFSLLHRVDWVTAF